jgi:hypothetical protein
VATLLRSGATHELAIGPTALGFGSFVVSDMFLCNVLLCMLERMGAGGCAVGVEEDGGARVGSIEVRDYDDADEGELLGQ